MEETQYNDTTVNVSKYNSGIAQIYRMDNLWKDTHTHSRNGEMDKWNWDLDRLWLELAADLKEVDSRVNKFAEFNNSIAELKEKLSNKKIEVSKYFSEIYQKQMEKELFLRRLQNDLGKGTAIDREEEFLD